MNLLDPRTLEPVYNKEGVTGRKMTTDLNFEIIYMTLEPGAYLKPHITPFDADFFIHKGNAILEIDGKNISAGEGMILNCPGSVPHGIRNDTQEQIIILVIKHLQNLKYLK